MHIRANCKTLFYPTLIHKMYLMPPLCLGSPLWLGKWEQCGLISLPSHSIKCFLILGLDKIKFTSNYLWNWHHKINYHYFCSKYKCYYCCCCCYCLVTKSCLILFNPMDCSTAGSHVDCSCLELAQTECPLSPLSWWLCPTISAFAALLLLLPSIFPSIRVFSNKLVLRIRWPKHWSFSFSINPSNEYSGLISYRIDLLDLLVVKGLSRVL